MCTIMKQNENTTDRIIRLVAGVILLAAGLYFTSGTLAIVLDTLGVVALFTAATGFCLLYKLFGLSTKK